MKLVITLCLVIATMTSTFAQEWLTDFETAKTTASKEDKKIVLVFQGSDWCAPCIKLDREVWSTDTFQSYAKKHYVMLQADFPKRKQNALDPQLQEHNNALAATYNKKGYFPFIVVLDSKGNVLGVTGYSKTTPDLFIDELESFKS